MAARSQYLEQGFLTPITVFTEEEAARLYRGYRDYVDRYGCEGWLQGDYRWGTCKGKVGNTILDSKVKTVFNYLFSENATNIQMSDCCYSLMTGISSYNSQFTPVYLLHTEKRGKPVLLLVFNMAFPASPFRARHAVMDTTNQD